METALRTALRDPAYGEDDAGEVESAKGRSREAVAAVVGGVRGTEVEGVIKGLSGEEQVGFLSSLFLSLSLPLPPSLSPLSLSISQANSHPQTVSTNEIPLQSDGNHHRESKWKRNLKLA